MTAVATRPGASGTRKSEKIDEFDEGSVARRPLGSDGGQFRWGAPVYKGDVTACYDDGLLFRIVETNNHNRWSFYNDTIHCQMEVQFIFGPKSNLKALENTKLQKTADGAYSATVTVYPMETELFVEGDMDGFTSNIKAKPLSDEYLKDMARQDNDFIKQESATLFNLVDPKATTDQMVAACVRNKVKFVDFYFPPEQKSIQIGSTVKLKVLPWERPCMYLSDANARVARLFRNGVHPSNLDEGDLGDSWLTGAIAALAEFPDKVRDLFRHPESVEMGQQERALGIYRITMNKNGWWTNVIVDDYLPVAGGRPKFARSKGDPAELWPCILEKAYAKVFGGYGFVIAGDPLHALQDLSGFPCSSFDNAFAESVQYNSLALFNLLQSYCEKGYLLIFTSPTRETIMTSRGAAQSESAAHAELVYSKSHILLGHIYTTIKMGYFAEHNLMLVQLRNPWAQEASEHWVGPWHRKDERWKKFPKVAEYFGFSEVDDGTFFMEWADVQDYFIGCGVCFMQHPVYDYRIRGTFFQNVPTTCLEITVTQPVVLTLILSQDDRRATTKVEYAPIMLSVACGSGALSPMRVDVNSGFDNDHPMLEYTFLQTRDVSLFYEFRPEFSPYMVVPRSMGNYSRLPYTLGILSPLEIGTESSAIRVAFRALAPENRVFDNFQKFNCETIATETEFQAKDVNQFFPDIYVGTVLQTSKD